jgi:hypothetical protein
MKVAIISAGIAASRLANMLSLAGLDSVAQNLPPVELTRRGPEIDFYPTQPSKQTAQWKRETRGRRLK